MKGEVIAHNYPMADALSADDVKIMPKYEAYSMYDEEIWMI